MRYKYIIIWFMTLAGIAFPVLAKAKLPAPEDFVRDFYVWFINADKPDRVAEMDNDIYKYVAKPTADRVRADITRGSQPGNVDYFTKVQDYNPDEWKANTTIHHAVPLNNGVTIVPATFGKDEKIDIIVFLKEVQGHWEIIKAEDVLPYP